MIYQLQRSYRIRILFDAVMCTPEVLWFVAAYAGEIMDEAGPDYPVYFPQWRLRWCCEIHRPLAIASRSIRITLRMNMRCWIDANRRVYRDNRVRRQVGEETVAWLGLTDHDAMQIAGMESTSSDSDSSLSSD